MFRPLIQCARGEAMSPQEGLYEEFCARFPYAETDDQLQAIADVMDDRERAAVAALLALLGRRIGDGW